MLPSFVKRRVRRAWLAGMVTMVWMNRRDLLRWTRFVRRSFSRRREMDWDAWMTEARVRAALTLDPVLRTDPEVDDVVVDDGRVTLLTSTTNWPDTAERVERFRMVKGVVDVQQEPGLLVGGARITSEGEPVL